MKKFGIIVIVALCGLFSPLRGSDYFSKTTLLSVEETVKGYLIKTPLIELPSLSAECGKRVFLKDESQQTGRSFKSRGVTYEVFKTIEELILSDSDLLREGLQLVTQTDGNHGIALISAIKSAIQKFSIQYPEKKEQISKIEPIIFTYKKVLPIKRETMEEMMREYRKVGTRKGEIFDCYEDYGTARVGREEFIKAQGGRAVYMEHGGIKTMQGHAMATLEILEQLKEYGVTDKENVSIMLPVGAGGPIGLAAAQKVFHPNGSSVMVQTPRFGAFIRSFHSGKIEYNDDRLSPYTVEVIEDGKLKPVIYEDGIAVDAPESEMAVEMGIKYLDDALYADPVRALHKIAPMILGDLDHYYKDKEKSVVGGTTAIVGDALFVNLDSKSLKDADVIVIFGTEGSIDPAIKEHTRMLLNQKREHS